MDRQIALEKVKGRSSAMRIAARSIGAAFMIGAAWFPANELAEFAGKTTSVHLDVYVGIMVTLSIAGGVGLAMKVRQQQKTIKRLRQRLRSLEPASLRDNDDV